MNWLPPEWQAAITTSAVGSLLVTAGCFILATLFKASIEKGIQNGMDIKIETIRSEFRKSEIELQNYLKSKEAQIEALRSSALSGLATRHAALDKRRLEATEKVWGTAIHLGQLKLAAKAVGAMNIEYAITVASKADAEGTKYRELADIIWKTFGVDKYKAAESIDVERPFVSPYVWALFTAYRHSLSHPIIQLNCMRTGVGSSILADPKPLLNMMKTAIPSKEEVIESSGPRIFPDLIDELEELLLVEIQKSLNNDDVDQENICKATKIIMAAEKIGAPDATEFEIPFNLLRQNS